jgi:predicted RNA-binding Zn-ribbon protein involved in translation (DUF1610 family)
MTREEAITYANCLKNNYTINFDDMADFCDMAIKALEQEPCEDCISRQAAIDLIADYEFYELNMGQVIKGIRDLSSVTPQPKTGHWIVNEYTWNDKITRDYKCSNCGYTDLIDANYCPNCGYRMLEGSE